MEQTFNVQLTISEGNALLTALSNFPYKESAHLIHKIQAFAQSQIQPEPLPELTEDTQPEEAAEE